MGITTHIDDKFNLRIHQVTGSTTLDDIVSTLKEIYSEPDFNSEMNVLWDLRGADLASFFTSNIQKLRDFVSAHWGTEGKSLAALIVSRDLEFGLSRMYEFFVESKTSNKVRVFRDYDEAFEWVTKS